MPPIGRWWHPMTDASSRVNILRKETNHPLVLLTNDNENRYVHGTAFFVLMFMTQVITWLGLETLKTPNMAKPLFAICVMHCIEKIETTKCDLWAEITRYNLSNKSTKKVCIQKRRYCRTVYYFTTLQKNVCSQNYKRYKSDYLDLTRTYTNITNFNESQCHSWCISRQIRTNSY